MYRRQLRWIGHVSRMKWDRLPRKFLTAWCNHERPLGRPVYRWSEGAEKAIQSVGLTLENWSVAAANRAQWGALVNPERAERERLLGKRSSSNNSSSNSNTQQQTPVVATRDIVVARQYRGAGGVMVSHTVLCQQQEQQQIQRRQQRQQ